MISSVMNEGRSGSYGICTGVLGFDDTDHDGRNLPEWVCSMYILLTNDELRLDLKYSMDRKKMNNFTKPLGRTKRSRYRHSLQPLRDLWHSIQGNRFIASPQAVSDIATGDGRRALQFICVLI